MIGVFLQILCWTEKIRNIEKDIAGIDASMPGGRYLKNKLSKYLRRSYGWVAQLYDPGGVHASEYRRDRQRLAEAYNGRSRGHSADNIDIFRLLDYRPVEWFDTDLLPYYRQKVAWFYGKYRGRLQDVVEGIEQRHTRGDGKMSVSERLCCAREIYRYLRGYIDITGVGRRVRVKRSAVRHDLGGMDEVYCLVCRKGVVRKMLCYHRGAKSHKRLESTFQGRKKLLDVRAAFGDPDRALGQYTAANGRMLESLRKDAHKGAVAGQSSVGSVRVRGRGGAPHKKRERIRYYYFCQICTSSFASGTAYMRHFRGARRHVQALEEKGVLDVRHFIGIYTWEGLDGMMEKEREIADEASFEEFEDAAGNVYDKRTYEDLINNGLL